MVESPLSQYFDSENRENIGWKSGKYRLEIGEISVGNRGNTRILRMGREAVTLLVIIVTAHKKETSAQHGRCFSPIFNLDALSSVFDTSGYGL